jgi:hypothetical protein
MPPTTNGQPLQAARTVSRDPYPANQPAFLTLFAFRHEVQTDIRRVALPTLTRTRCTLGSQRRFVARIEWLL